MSQQAQLKTTSVILKIDIINSPQQEANGPTLASSSEPIKGGQKAKMAQLKLVHTLLASLVVLLVLGGVAYLAIIGTNNQQQQQPKQDSQSEQAQQATTVAQWSSANLEGSANRLSSSSVALSSTVSDTQTATTFGRPATSSDQAQTTTTIQDQATSAQQRTTTSQQGTSASASVEMTSRMFGAPVAALSTTQAAQPSPNASTADQSVAAEPIASQPVQIQDTKMSILQPDPSTETSAPTTAQSAPVVETIPIHTATVTTSTSSQPTSSSDPTTTQELEQAWQEFKAMYRRQYPSQEEESSRMEIFLANTRYIASHNKQTDSTYRLGMNHFGDYTRDEINLNFIGPQISWSQTLSHLQTPIPPPMKILSDVGESQPQVDWRNITSGSPIDQNTCHESSVFAAVASIEAALNAKLSLISPAPGSTWQPVKLSESQVLDCMRTVAPANAPPICMGYSSMLHVFDLLQRSPLGGIVSLAEYMDFISRNPQPMCDLPQAPANLNDPMNQPTVYPPQPRAKLSTFNVIHRDNIPEALVNSGPLVVALDASQSSFHFYKSGLYHDQNCSVDTYNHHALLIGIQPVDINAGDSRHNTVDPISPAQYLIRNSLGLDWGEGGHMRLLKVEDNKCLPQVLAISPNLL